MKKKIKYSNEPIEARVISDFLPSPETLVLREKKKRVTLTLSEKSLNFFKGAAKKHNASYQAMIRRLLDYYVANQRS
ncbi:MAG: BrnA antitoxin family protein [Candidatus Levybacteria bacterium]|nr:BrnA antitoxin family protein [Candidatus Levybacteria bacterium]